MCSSFSLVYDANWCFGQVSWKSERLDVVQLPLGEAWHPYVQIDRSVLREEIPQSVFFHSILYSD